MSARIVVRASANHQIANNMNLHVQVWKVISALHGHQISRNMNLKYQLILDPFNFFFSTVNMKGKIRQLR